MSLFGNTNNAAPSTVGGIFGTTDGTFIQPQQIMPSNLGNTSGVKTPPLGSSPLPQVATQTSLFGGGTSASAQPLAQPTTSLFGNTNTTNALQGTSQPTTSLFGGQQQQQQPSLFGGTSSTTNTGGGLFGSTNTNTNQGTTGGGLFGGGGQQGGRGLFGSTSNQQQQQPTGGGLFGSSTQQTQPSTTGLFGSTSQQPQQQSGGTGLFGSTNNNQQQQQPNAGGGSAGENPHPWGDKPGLFGSASNTQQSGQTGESGGGWGNKPGLFGSTSNTQQSNAGGGLFGNSTQQSGQSAWGSKPGLFGSTSNTGTTNPLLGGQQQQQQQNTSGGLFNSQQRPGAFSGSTLGTSALGASTLNSNLLSSRLGGPSSQQQQDPQTQFQKLTQQIEGIYNAWNPNSPQNRFQHIFYNLVDPNQVSLYGRPPNATNDALWEKAVKENPDPSCLVPVIAVGFDNLRERVDAQSRTAEQQQQKLKDLRERLEALNTQHAVTNAARLQRATAQQTQITQRLLAFIQHLHLLIPAIRSSSIRPEEEHLRGKLEEIEDEIRRGRLKGKLNELWALLGAVNASREKLKSSAPGWEWTVVDEDGLAQIAQILAEQQAGLAYLTKILHKNMKDLKKILGGDSELPSGEESYINDRDNLRSSSNTMRASKGFR